MLWCLAGLFTGHVSAQTSTPEPTATPTPTWQQAVPMSTGNSLLVVKSVTYGDMAITTAVLLLAAVELVKGFVTIPHQWIKRP